MNEKFFGNELFLLYIYSVDIQKEFGAVKYHPEAIIDFPTYADLNNKIPNIMQYNILDILKNSPNFLREQYGCKICLYLNKDKQPKYVEKINDNVLFDNDEGKFFNVLLKISLMFYCKYNNFYGSIKNNSQTFAQKMYLINKKYIDQIKSFIHFKEVDEAIKTNSELKKNLANENFDYANFKRNLKKEILIEFFKMKKTDIDNKLSDNNLFDKSFKIIQKNFRLFPYTIV